MSFAKTLDRLVDFKDYAVKYSGHRDWDTVQVPADPTSTGRSRSKGKTIQECAQWLQEPLAGARSAQLKILFITTFHPTSPDSLSYHSDELKAARRRDQVGVIEKVFEDAGLPIAGFGSYVRTLLSFAQVPSASYVVGQQAVARYYYSCPAWGVTWSFCPTTGHTKAVFLCREKASAELLEYLRTVLVSLGEHADHPMLLGYMIIEFSLTELCAIMLKTSNEVLSLEQNTGLSAWDWVHEHEITGKHVPIDYEYTSKRLSMLSGKITHIRFRFRTLKEYTKSVIRIAEKHTSRATDPAAKRRCEQVDEILGVLAEYIEVRLHKADSIQERITSQVSGMSNIITQRDTSAMKTVAVVTMAFLPGTFVASFFAMPMLNWDAATSDGIVSHRFWIYWAVTLPLTVGVFVLWWIRQIIKEKAERNADRERAAAAATAGAEVDGAEAEEDAVQSHVFPKGISSV